MKTPTPQEQAERLIEAHLPNTEQFDYRNGYQPDEDAATESAIVTVEYAIKVLQSDRLIKVNLGWDEEYDVQSKVLTILKGKL